MPLATWAILLGATAFASSLQEMTSVVSLDQCRNENTPPWPARARTTMSNGENGSWARMPAGSWARGKGLCNQTEPPQRQSLPGRATSGLVQHSKERVLGCLCIGAWILVLGLLLHTLQHDGEYDRLAGLRSLDLWRHELHGVAAQLGFANLRCSDRALNERSIDRDRNLRTSKRV